MSLLSIVFHRPRRQIVFLVILALAELWPGVRAVRAQQTSNPPEMHSHEMPPPFQIRVERNVVVVRVVVRDKDGRAVGNLTKDDFRLFDDAKPRAITGFTVETGLRAGPASPPSAAAQAGSAPGSVPATPPLPARFVGLFFDDLHLSREAAQRTRNAAWSFVTTDVGPEDRVAIFTASHHDDLDFTDDRVQLHDALFRIRPRSLGQSQTNTCPSIDAYQAYLIDQRQDPQAIDIAFTEAYNCDCVQMDDKTVACVTEARDRSKDEAADIWNRADLDNQNALAGIAAAVNRLAAMAGQRTLVLVSPGFLTETRSDDIEALIRNALHQDVVISAIDAAGLEPFTPPLMATLFRPDLQTQKDLIYKAGETFSRDVLASLAAGTGGTFFRNSNDFAAGFHEAAGASEAAYVLSFSPEGFKPDGKFHSLKVTLNRHEPWSVEARRGYFDPEAPSDERTRQDALDALMFSRNEIHALAVDVSTQTGRLVKPPATLTLVIHVDMERLPLRKENDRSVNTLIFDTAVFDRDGKYVSGKEESLELHLKDASLRKLAAGGMYLKTSFEPPPGTYRIREVVRDAVSKQLSALNCEVEIPGGKRETAAQISAGPASKPQSRVSPEAEQIPGASMAAWTPEAFTRAIPELKGLRTAVNQDGLPLLLARLGTSVKTFFDTLPDVTAREEIVLQRLDWTGHVVETELEQFNYLDTVRASAAGNLLAEYRTDTKGRRADPSPLEGGFVTHGFASLPDLFHPGYQADATYRYLGEQDLRGRTAEVVYFRQIPGKARPEEIVRAPDRTVDVLVQGVAWIDATSYQIARLRTDIAYPEDDPYLSRITTDSRFVEVHFSNEVRAVWLPAEVTVTINWRGQTYCNLHRYSKYQLFRVSSNTQVSAPRPERSAHTCQ